MIDIPTLAHFDARRFGTDSEDSGKTREVAYMEVKSRAGVRGRMRWMHDQRLELVIVIIFSESPTHRCGSRSSNQLSHCNIPQPRPYGLFGGMFKKEPSVNTPHLRLHLQFGLPLYPSGRASISSGDAGRSVANADHSIHMPFSHT